MWESLLTAVIGGLVVNGFAIVLGAFLWVKHQSWNQKREIYAELLPTLSRFIQVNRSITATMDDVLKGERPDQWQLDKWFE